MKSVLSATVALAALALFSDPAFAEQKETSKNPPTAAATTQPSAAAKNSAHATEQVMTGKVIKVDAVAKTFTVTSKGKQFTFSAAKQKGPLPKVGSVVDITYTQPTPGGPMYSSNLNSSRSNTF
jgi:hypothetical protein